MVDELDPILEGRLRAVLRREADVAAVTVRPAELRRAAAERARSRRFGWFAVLGVAAAIAVVVGGVSLWTVVRPGPDAAGPPTLADLPSVAQIIEALDGSAVAGTHEAAAPASDGRFDFGDLHGIGHVAIALVCSGGRVDISVVGASVGPIEVATVPCSTDPDAVKAMAVREWRPENTAEADDVTLHVRVDAVGTTAWRVVAADVTGVGAWEPEMRGLPSYERMRQFGESGATEAFRGEGTIMELNDAFIHEFPDGVVAHHYVVACTGSGQLEVLVTFRGVTDSLGHVDTCDGGVSTFSWTTDRDLTGIPLDGPFSVRLEAAGRTGWRLLVLDSTDQLPATPAPIAPRALASFDDLERVLLDGTNGQLVFGRGEQPVPEQRSGEIETTLATLPDGYQFVNVALDCADGSYTIAVIHADASESPSFTASSECPTSPEVIVNGSTFEGPARVVIRTIGPIAWRAVVGGWLPDAAQPTAPPPADLEPGETRLVRADVVADGAPVERVVTIPDGTDAVYLTAPCAGTGLLEIVVDGVAADYPCGSVGIETFAPGDDDQLELRASATGSAAFALRLGAVDWAIARPDAWQPPVLRIEGPDATAGDITTTRAFPGCGWSWQPKGGGGGADSCGPSWQPMPTALVQDPGAWNRLRLGGGWTITDVQGRIARNADVVASGRSPASEDLVVTRDDTGWQVTQPPAGDWAIVLLVSAEKDGDRFQVPYYTRIVVEAGG